MRGTRSQPRIPRGSRDDFFASLRLFLKQNQVSERKENLAKRVVAAYSNQDMT